MIKRAESPAPQAPESETTETLEGVGVEPGRLDAATAPQLADAPVEEKGGAEEGADEGLAPRLEAVLFVAGEPLSARRLAEVTGASSEGVRAALEELSGKYGADAGVQLVEIAGGFRLLTHPDCAPALAALRGKKVPDRLSSAALETLAIVAYKQPVGRAEIERIRGVGVGPVLRHLLDLDLIRVAGREEGLGRALLYGTTRSFLDRFGLKSPRDLPGSLEL